MSNPWLHLSCCCCGCHNHARYQALNSLALKLVAPGGVFMTCSCSGAMTQGGDFPQVRLRAQQMLCTS